MTSGYWHKPLFLAILNSRTGSGGAMIQPATESQSTEIVREEAVNTLLAKALQEGGIAARAERRGRLGTPDVRVNLKTGDAVILECKWIGAESLLAEQLDRRLRADAGTLAYVGVCYPERLKTADDLSAALESADDLQWWIHGSRGAVVQERRLRSGSVEQLANHLLALAMDLEGVDRVAAAAGVIGYALEQSAKQIARHARVARAIADIIAKTDQEKDRAKALRIGCLALFNALAFQDRLSAINEEVPTTKEAWRQGISGLRAAWGYICERIDYVPVFGLAAQVLDELIIGSGELQASAITPLLEAVDNTHSLEGHDLSGRLFHTLLSDAKFTGAYYTSVPAATLLSRLVFHNWPPHVDWSDHEFPAALNIADLACGTGTLLMAMAAEAERRHLAAGGQQAAALHKAMVEQAIHGYDVQLSAVHFAATSLAMLNPNIQFDRMNLYVMPYGSDGAKVSLGSLDFLGKDEVAVQFALSPDIAGGVIREAAKVYGNGSQTVANGETVRLPILDLAVMNPPFTRSGFGNLLFGSLPAAERSKLQQELKDRLKSRPATATAGLGAAFVAAVTPKLRPGEGRLALVLPATVCTGPSWEPTRALIEQDFTLNMVVASHDPRRYNFSDSTDLSEVLLIATRRPDNGKTNKTPEGRTIFVNLWQNPDSIVDAHRTAQEIAATPPADFEGTGSALLEVDGRHIGELVSIPESRLVGKQWFGLQFARADVLRAARSLLDNGEVRVPGGGNIAKVPMAPLAELGEIGPDSRRLDDGFVKTRSITAYPLVDRHNTEEWKSLACAPNAYLAPLPKPRGKQNPGYGVHLWQQAGRLLIAARFRANTSRVLAMRSERNVLGRMWWPVRVGDAEQEKALTVWLNSSVGLLSLLGIHNTTMGSWVQLKKAELAGFPVLDPRALAPEQRTALTQLFDALAAAEFERLPAMVDCPARRALDDGLSEILGLPNLAELRRLLASEPVVSNRRL